MLDVILVLLGTEPTQCHTRKYLNLLVATLHIQDLFSLSFVFTVKHNVHSDMCSADNVCGYGCYS
jgi:hypothetical protein